MPDRIKRLLAEGATMEEPVVKVALTAYERNLVIRLLRLNVEQVKRPDTLEYHTPEEVAEHVERVNALIRRLT